MDHSTWPQWEENTMLDESLVWCSAVLRFLFVQQTLAATSIVRHSRPPPNPNGPSPDLWTTFAQKHCLVKHKWRRGEYSPNWSTNSAGPVSDNKPVFSFPSHTLCCSMDRQQRAGTVGCLGFLWHLPPAFSSSSHFRCGELCTTRKIEDHPLAPKQWCKCCRC